MFSILAETMLKYEIAMKGDFRCCWNEAIYIVSILLKQKHWAQSLCFKYFIVHSMQQNYNKFCV